MVEWIGAAVALIAAGAAIWQAAEARKARTAADESAQSAAGSWTRMADALEAQEARAAAEAARYLDPWGLQREVGRTLTRWHVHLGGNETLTDIEWSIEPGDDRFAAETNLLTEMRPGQAVTLHVLRAMGIPASFELTITYRRPGEQQLRERLMTLQVR